MSSAQLIDLDSLSVPLDGSGTSGTDPRANSSIGSTYAQLRDARKSARAAERSNLFDTDKSAADDDWRNVLELAPTILKNEAKDLEVACWYTEALVRKSGFQGLRDGFSLIRSLIENYWDGLYPLPDEDGLTTRVSPLTGLNGEGAEGVLIVPIRNVLLTENVDPGPFNYWQYKQALDAQRITDDHDRKEVIDKNGFSLDDINRAVELSSQQFYIDLRDDVQEALSEYKVISQLLDELCGVEHSPPTSNVINTLSEIQGAISHIARNKLPQEIINSEETQAVSEDGRPSTSVVTQAVKSREDAFRQLIAISQFFRQTEPHSPISYVLEKAVKWGNMPLSELINELIPDSSSRDTYSSLTGVVTNED